MPVTAPRPRRLALALVCLCALLALLAAPQASGADELTPYIVGGQVSPISQYPWQVFLVGEVSPTFDTTCGGAILDATHVLTAAHCVDMEESTSHYPVEDFFVLAGASEALSLLETGKKPVGSQLVQVASERVHPYYTPLTSAAGTEPRDDVAVLTLAQPLTLSAAANAEPIGLVAAGATPAAGTALAISGYGKQDGAESSQPDGKLYGTTLAALSPLACTGGVAQDSAVLLCAQGASSATCQGDSGGPLTEGSPAVEVGIVSFGPIGCPPGGADAFTNLAAGEVRGFIEGSETPPVAARASVLPSLHSVRATAVDYSPLTCEPGSWTGSPTLTFTFQIEGPAQTVLQSGASNVYLPQSNVVGSQVACIVQASNPGGVSTLRGGVTAPVANDTLAPSATIAGAPKCHLQTCTLAIHASDPNDVALSVRASAAYAVRAVCAKRERKAHPRAVCHRTKTVAMSLAQLAAGSYQASVTHLPYGEAVRFSARASNAALLEQAVPASTTTKLRKPKPKSKRHTH